LKDEIHNLKASLKGLEEKYDLEIIVKKKHSIARNQKGKIVEFLKLEQIGVSSIKKNRALPKSEKRLSKV
jgi:hypothetical protein